MTDSRPGTYEHIGVVRRYLGDAIAEILDRADKHDASKLTAPELEVFDEFVPGLASCEYGSAEYDERRKAMGEALEHHYEANPHHPEHHEHGIRDMTLIDLLEMVCDWKAASERHRPSAPAAPGRPDAPAYDDDFARSIELNQERFGYGDEVKGILLATAHAMGWTGS